MSAKPQTLYLLDSHALLYRAYHAIRPGTMLAADRKTPTNAVFGFANTIRALRNRFKPDLLSAVFDPHGEVQRSAQYDRFAEKLGPKFSGYKTHRDAMPDDLRPQIDLALELCDGYGIPVFQIEGFEADDVLGTLAIQAKKKGFQVIVVSADKDLLQLVQENILVFDPSKDLMYDEAKVESVKGVKPAQIVDWLGFRGDSVDNIPGVSGVGEQTATKLLQTHGSMEAALAHYRQKFTAQAEEITAFVKAHEKAAQQENGAGQEKLPPVKPPKGVKVVEAYLFAQQDHALASRDLATLCTDLPLEIDFEKLRCRPPQVDRLAPFLKRMDFKTFLRDLDKEALAQFEAQARDALPSPLVGEDLGVRAAECGVQAAAEIHYELIDDKTKFERFAVLFKRQKRFAVDTETTSVNPREAELVGVSVSWHAGEAYYLPVRALLGSQTLEERQVLALLKPALEDPNIEKIGHHIKYDIQVFRRHGIMLRGVAFDTMIGGWLLDPGALRLNLEEMALLHLGLRKTETQALLGKGKKQLTMDLVPTEDVSAYACMDADYTWQLSQVLAPKLADAGLDPLMREIEVPLIGVLADMEWTGIRVDGDVLRKMSRELEQQLAAQETEIYKLAGENFNISSPKQLGVILFEKMKLASRGKTSTGQDSTSEEVLTILAKEHPLPRMILDYRGMLKLKNTYVDALPQMISSRTGRIHASFHQTGAETGRISSNNPNLQNIPVRSKQGREIRKAFRAGHDGWKILGADYSQIELRILAHYCQDEALLAAFEKGVDIHTAVAARLNQVSEAEVTPEQRGRAKTVNFGILYGQTAFGLASVLEIGRTEAQNIIDSYFSGHPGVRKCIDEIVAQAREQGYVTTVLGRRRFIPQLRAADRGARMLGERLAVNTVFQGSAADLIKKAMIEIYQELQSEDWKSKMLLQIHDELLFECPPEELERLGSMVKQKMEGALKLKVPLVVEVGSGENWLEAKN